MPNLHGRTGPRYLAIVDALADDIGAGRLASGDRLPTHRDLADRLRVTVGTVSRAYHEARVRGLLVGEVGRGTFVRAAPVRPDAPAMPLHTADDATIDLGVNFMRMPDDPVVADTLRALVDDPIARAMVEEYRPQQGTAEHRAAGAAWLARAGLDVAPDRVLVCAGAQHAMAVAFMGLVRPGEVVLCESLTYPAVLALARSLHVELHGVEMDRDGLLPDALDAACRSHKARALYCMPNLHNPTTRVMPQSRRAEIATVASRHGLAIIEDDVYGFLLEQPSPPLSMQCERGHFLTSASKSMAPGMRVGFLALPSADKARFVEALWATTVMAPLLTAEIVARWILDGSADRMVAARRSEARARQAIAREVLGGQRYETRDDAMQLWLDLPAPWRASDFVAAALQQGVAVTSGDAFGVGRPRVQAIRVALGGARSREHLRRGLEVVASLLSGAAPACVV